MNIFLTVGTTSFDTLVKAVDTGSHAKNTVMQIADGNYAPKMARSFSFQLGIQEYIDKADVVVCHAGAGSIFRLLQAGLVPLVVPNTERQDKHQLEIARWLERKRYAVVAMNPSEVNLALDSYIKRRQECVQFSEQRFFYQDSLNQLVRKLVVSES